MTPAPSDLLEALRVHAMTLEAQNRYGTLDRRTVTHEVSPTLRLLVMAYYRGTNKAGVSREFMAMCGTLRYGKAHIVYAAVHPDVLGWVELTKAEALELLERHALPEPKRSLPERPLVDDDRLWDTPAREVAKAKDDAFIAARSLGPRKAKEVAS